MTQVNVGDRVELTGPMVDEPDPIPVGTKGTVTFINELTGLGSRQIAVNWDGGRRLMLSDPPDQFRVL